jgi:hypothetical protein
MENKEDNVKNVKEVKYATITYGNLYVQIVMVLKYVNQEKNHIILDVGREAIENIMVFAHIVLLIFFQMTLKQKALEKRAKK